jgi:hypothetical protein
MAALAPGRAVARGGASAAGRLAVRALLVVLALATLAISPPSPRRDRATGLADTTRRAAFSIVGWEVGALLDKAAHASGATSPPERRVEIVRAHFANAAEIRRLRERRDALFARAEGTAAVERELAGAQASFDAGRAEVEAIVAEQVDAVLREQALRERLLELVPGGGWPLPFLRIEPNVLFTYQRLPLNLVVAEPDRLGIVGSVLVSPDLATAEIEALEERVDGLGVSSLVSGIGGFGSYPSMVPDTDSLRRGLDVIAHEWVHHYLAFRPLGQAFFASYEMRSMNETVADLIGDEVGGLVFDRYYRASEPPAPARAPAPAAGPRADFGVEMRRVRREVERLLAAGDRAGAERYMAEQREELARLGWHVRKLNTAYLSFFGVYGGGGNHVESPLRALRERSSSLAAFLRAVERFDDPADLAAAG